MVTRAPRFDGAAILRQSRLATDAFPAVPEIALDRLLIDHDQQLGGGTFGVVYRGRATGALLGVHRLTGPDEQTQTETKVTVTMAKWPDSDECIRAVVDELAVWTRIGAHANCCELLGAVTRTIGQRQVYLIGEYCALGDLQRYLSVNRVRFVDEWMGADGQQTMVERFVPAPDSFRHF